MKQVVQHLGVALLTVLLGGRSAGSESSRPRVAPGNPPTAAARAETRSVAPHDEVRPGERLSVRVPDNTLVVALSRWGSSTLAAIDVTTGSVVSLVTRPTGPSQFAMAAGRVAYLMREGVNPARNYVEVLDVRGGHTHVLEPASNFAILGFTFEPNGERLSYAGMDMRLSNSRGTSWRSGLVDVDALQTRTVAASGPDRPTGPAIPVPFAWSRTTGDVYLQGLLPFRGMVHHGIWAMRPDGSGVRQVLPETSYTGHPRLSADGSYLAYLSTQLDAFPEGYTPAPGAPPGNVLVVMNLLTGEEVRRAADAGAAFGALAWSASSTEILVGHREWRDGRFHDAGFLRGTGDGAFALTRIAATPSPATPSPTVTDLGECRVGGPVLWVEADTGGARLRTGSVRGGGTPLLTLPEGTIQIVGCFGATRPTT